MGGYVGEWLASPFIQRWAQACARLGGVWTCGLVSHAPRAPQLLLPLPCAFAGSSKDKKRIEQQLKEREEQHKKFEEAKKAAAAGAGLRQFGAASSEVRCGCLYAAGLLPSLLLAVGVHLRSRRVQIHTHLCFVPILPPPAGHRGRLQERDRRPGDARAVCGEAADD